MKIGLEGGLKIHQREAIESGTHLDQKKVNKAATILDITGGDMDVSAYGVQGRTFEDISREAEAYNVKTASDACVVMSNTMSEEDYRKAMEEGYDPSDMDMEESANILDHIKTVMAQSGQIVAGYNDDLTGIDLEDVTGSKISAESIRHMMEASDLPATDKNITQIQEAAELIENISELPEGSIKYMVENRLSPTIENVYTARFSAAGDGNRQMKGYYRENQEGYLARKGSSEDVESLRPQLEKAVREMGLVNITQEEAESAADWLLDKGLPVTKENIEKYTELNSIHWPIAPEDIAKAAIRSIGEGHRAKEANLSPDYSTAYEGAKELLRRISDVRGREEIRLQMTLEAAGRMLKSGIDIDTKDLSQLVEELRSHEEEVLHKYFGEGTIQELEEKADIYSDTIDAARSLPVMPAQTLGAIIKESSETTLQVVSELGKSLASQLKEANLSYETMMTAPRRDMGDSYAKAFANIDNILEDLGKQLTEENRKAVRILGYNGMNIDNDNLEAVKTLDRQVKEVIDKLTPAKTLELIRAGINPLKLTMEELSAKVSAIETNPAEDNERFSRFLYKLQQSNSITPEERDSYIGIYRLLNRLEKTDYAAIGQVLEQGDKLTFGRLLTAMRSRKVTVDAAIDDNFGFLTEKVEKGISITAQIEAALSNQLGSDDNKELEEQMLKNRFKEYKEILDSANAAAIDTLEADNIPVTVSNLEALLQFSKEPGSLFNNINRLRSKNKDTKADASDEKETNNSVERILEGFEDSLTDKTSAEEGYWQLHNELESVLVEAQYATDNIVDLKSIALMHKQLGLAAAQASEENYHVPVMIGDSITDINLRLIHGKEQGLVTVHMTNDVFGEVNGEIRINEDRASLYMVGSEDNGTERLQSVALAFARGMEDEGIKVVDARAVKGSPHIDNKHYEKNADNTKESTAKLYKAAKVFISAVKNIE